MDLTFIRHAISKGNEDHSIYYKMLDYEVPLSEQGIKDAEKINFSKWDFTEIYCSPYIRCLQTRDLIFTDHWGGLGVEDPLLIERQWGGLRDLVDGKDFDPKIHFNFFYRPKNGESFFDVYQRVVLFFNQIRETHNDSDKICIISHGEWIRVALMYLDKTTVQKFHEDRVKVKNLEIINRFDVL